jgi:predicted RNA-binding protein YlqC (UPF0109 family)
MKHQPLFDTLTEIVTEICQYPEALRVFTEDLDGKHILTVMPHTADHPKLVGHHGRQINAFKHLAETAGIRLGERMLFQLKDSFVGQRDPDSDFVYNPRFDVVKFHRLLAALFEQVTGRTLPFTVQDQKEALRVSVSHPRGDSVETVVHAISAILFAYCRRHGRRLQMRSAYLIPHES